MKKKYSLTLDNEFIQFCKINGITDIEKKAKEVFEQGFNLEKYGNNPFKNVPYIPIVNTLTNKTPQLRNLENLKNPTQKKDDLYD